MHVAGQPGLVRLHEIEVANKFHGAINFKCTYHVIEEYCVMNYPYDICMLQCTLMLITTQFFLLCDFVARLGLGLVGNCLYQMIILYSVAEILSSCD